MKSVSMLMIIVAVCAILCVAVDAAASDKITQLKARVESQSSDSVAAAAPPALKMPFKLAGAAAVKAAVKAGKPCAKVPTFKLPVKLEGIADQMPGDKENNEKLINKAEGDIQINKAKIIKEQVLKDSYSAVAAADVAKQNFQDLQAVVLREPLIPA